MSASFMSKTVFQIFLNEFGCHTATDCEKVVQSRSCAIELAVRRLMEGLEKRGIGFSKSVDF
jgi:hypothetical protein